MTARGLQCASSNRTARTADHPTETRRVPSVTCRPPLDVSGSAVQSKKARVEWVDGVHCSHNFASGNVIVGTGLVGHDQRDCFKLKAHSTLEEQVRARPKFAALAAAAAGGGATGESDEQVAKQDSLLPGVAAPREQAQPAGVLFGGERKAPSRQQWAGPHALMPHKLESELGVAWEFLTERREQAQRAAEEQRSAAQRELIEAKREKERQREISRKRAREASEPAREPCLCTPAGAAELLRESQQQTRDALQLAAGAIGTTKGTLKGWLQREKK